MQVKREETLQTVYKGRLLHCLIKETVLPNGYRVRLEMIQHPGAVLMVPFLNTNTIVMLKQYRAVVGEYLYEFPAGTLEQKEKLVSCAHRELIEETGYTAKVLTYLGKIIPVPGYSTEVIHIYKAEKLALTQQDIQADEVITVLTLTLNQIRGLVKKGKIVDAKTICALALSGII